MRKFLVFAILTAFLCAVCGIAPAQEVSGRFYDTFIADYAQNIDFINYNTGRRLLPLLFTEKNGVDGRTYSVSNELLTVTVETDISGELVQRCQIVLTAPTGMEPGSMLEYDYFTAGYHSYALLMAMHSGETAYERYDLKLQVEQAMAQGPEHTLTCGAYTLHCLRADRTMTLLFEHRDFITPDETPAPALPDDGGEPLPPDADDEDEDDSYIG